MNIPIKLRDFCEMKITMVLCVVPYLLSWNIWELQHSPDLPSTMVLLCGVMCLHCFCVAKLPAIVKPWEFVVQMALLYLCCQFLMVMIWDPICDQLQILKDRYILRPVAIYVFKKHPGLIYQVNGSIVYIVELIICLICTIFTLKWTRSLYYLLPRRMRYRYFVKKHPDLRTQLAIRQS